MEVNKQKREGIAPLRFGDVEIVDIWKTIQGEGPLAGCPSVFIRLAGCNLRCPWCDTDYTSNRKLWRASEVVELVRAIRPSGLVVLTGGEPFRQDIGPLIELLLEAGYEIQIETNGTLFRPNIPFDQISIVCSPKTPKVHPGLIPYITAWKYVIDADHIDPTDGLPSETLGGFAPAKPSGENPLIYIQPMDFQDPKHNRMNTEAAVDVCLKFDYRLQIQIQKIVGLK
tara:strand:- start:2395 stop:3075 length:681 start_codon:yes stop_codon:yes gene_type:complete